MHVQYRPTIEATAFAASGAGAEGFDLPTSGLLTGLELYMSGVNGSTAGKPDVWIHDRITKLELIVNGSQVVKSYSGDQVLADMLYKKTPLNSHDAKNMINGSAIESLYLNMGRFYHDMEYLLDLASVKDPEIRFTYDFGMTAQNGWTNGVAMATQPSLTMIPHIVRDLDIPPRGYIKTSEVGRFTGAASKKENVKLPRGPRYANIYVQSLYKAAGLGYQLDKLELNIDNDKSIPVRIGVDQLADIMARQYGKFVIGQQSQLKGGQSYPFAIEHGMVASVQNGLDNAHFGMIDLWGNNASPGFVKDSDGLTPLTGSYNCFHRVEGVFPFSVTAIPYFDLMDERTWIDSSQLGSLWVRIELNASGNSSSVIKVLADEVITAYQ